MTLLEGAPTRANKNMDGWKVLEQAVPDGHTMLTAALTQAMGVSVDTLYRWRRRPLTSETPAETGRRNPLDYVAIMLVTLTSVHREGADQVWEWLDHLRAVLRAEQAQALPVAEMEAQLREIEREVGKMADVVARLRGNEKL